MNMSDENFLDLDLITPTFVGSPSVVTCARYIFQLFLFLTFSLHLAIKPYNVGQLLT